MRSGRRHSPDGVRGVEQVQPVTLAPFAISRHEVTFAQWDACVADGGCGGHRPEDEGWGRGERPVMNVSKHDADAYTQWLTSRTGRAYRLPTAEEWEYAARGGTVSLFHTGARIGPDQANFNHTDRRLGRALPPVHDRTTPVGSYPANPFGLHDMLGNVAEWTSDCGEGPFVGPFRPNAPAPMRGFLGKCSRGKVRGGSWLQPAASMRMRFIKRSAFGSREPTVGFRVAVSKR